jgi:hypothetical protein
MRYFVTPASRWKKNCTVHRDWCRYTNSHGEWVEKVDIPKDAVDCLVCGGRIK